MGSRSALFDAAQPLCYYVKHGVGNRFFIIL